VYPQAQVLADPLLGALFGRPPMRLYQPCGPAGIRPSVRLHLLRGPRRWLRVRDLLCDARDPSVVYSAREICRAIAQLEAAGVVESRRRARRPWLGRKEYRLVVGIRKIAPDLCLPTGAAALCRRAIEALN